MGQHERTVLSHLAAGEATEAADHCREARAWYLPNAAPGRLRRVDDLVRTIPVLIARAG